MRLKSLSVCLSLGVLAFAACARSSSMNGISLAGVPDMSPNPPSPDPRVGLPSGWFNAGQATWNLRAVSMTRPSKDFLNESTPGDRRLVNSDLAFTGNYVFQGNYSGWQVWDISNPNKPKHHKRLQRSGGGPLRPKAQPRHRFQRLRWVQPKNYSPKESDLFRLRSRASCKPAKQLKRLLPATFSLVVQESLRILESRNRLEAEQLC